MGNMQAGIGISSCLVALTTTLLFSTLIRRRESASGFTVISPSAVFMAGILARFGLGSLIIGLMPESLVLDGEYRQYIVSWIYSEDVSRLWIVYVLAGGLLYSILEIVMYRKSMGTESAQRECSDGWFSWIRRVRSGTGNEWKIVKLVSASCLGVFFVGTCIAAITGSMDRGGGYEFWASMPFRPEAPFIAFVRLKQIGYFLLPITWKHCSRALRILLGISAASPLLLEAIAGGRGAVLYPLAMVFLGYMCVCLRPKRLLLNGALIAIFFGVAVPYMAAYRDSSKIREISHGDVVGRLGALLVGVDRDRIGYRYMALGREIYACSDGYIVEAAKNRNGTSLRAGLDDINLKTIGRIILPRWLSKDKSYEKGDGAQIAKRLMGVENKNWYPCITSPADLFRREGWLGVLVGGGLMGGVIWSLEVVWLRVGVMGRSVQTLILTVLPAAYIQSGLYGTVKELLWQLAWDLPKYVLAICVIGWIAKRVEAVAARQGKSRSNV